MGRQRHARPTLTELACYIPSIDITYGRSTEQWFGRVREQNVAGTLKHGDLVTWLKTERGLSHGHANAVVAHPLGLIKAEAD